MRLVFFLLDFYLLKMKKKSDHRIVVKQNRDSQRFRTEVEDLYGNTQLGFLLICSRIRRFMRSDILFSPFVQVDRVIDLFATLKMVETLHETLHTMIYEVDKINGYGDKNNIFGKIELELVLVKVVQLQF